MKDFLIIGGAAAVFFALCLAVHGPASGDEPEHLTLTGAPGLQRPQRGPGAPALTYQRGTCRRHGCNAEPADYNPERPGDNGFCETHAVANEQRRRQQTVSTNQLTDRRFFRSK